jgi:hypothetical protein
MSEKPSWNLAPEWANYLAQDRDGGWIWYEHEPKAGDTQWHLSVFKSRWKYQKEHTVIENWEDTLEQRPTGEK